MIENQFEDFVMVQVGIKKLYEDAVVPKYQTSKSAGCDLHAYTKGESVAIQPGEIKLIGTGIVIELPNGYEGQVRPRSGLALKYGIGLANSLGTIDEDYKGEVGVIMINHGKEPFIISHGDRIAQLIVSPYIQATFHEIEEVKETERGSGGFGHTGV